MRDKTQIDTHLARVQKQFNEHSQHHGIDVTCSIGVALFPVDGRSVKQLMSLAKYALTQAKKTKIRFATTIKNSLSRISKNKK